jgi:NTP pyrophosphatase (non-canonical NTP hydrolase)
MTISEITKDIHENAIAHGWWDEERTFGDIIALCHSELSEALEEYRCKRPAFYYVCEMEQDDGSIIPCVRTDHGDDNFKGEKPEGTAVELADCIIRILDYCGKEKIDIEHIIEVKNEYNKTRPYRHGNKVL